MPTIKNGQELVNRAQWHREMDHVAQGTYGDAEMNGHVDYQGCLIGCAAMPWGLEDMRLFIEKNFYQPGDDLAQWEIAKDSTALIHEVTREFGICSGLLRAAEAIFESLPYHGQAIEFVYAFNIACSKAEGYSIRNRDVRRFWDDHPYAEREDFPFESLGMDCRPNINGAAITEVAADFLAWIEATPERKLPYPVSEANKTEVTV